MISSQRRSLLSAARAFIRGSAGITALAIVPLATVAMTSTAQAGGPTVFNPPGGASGFNFGNGFFTGSSYTTNAMPQLNGIVGVRIASSGTFFNSGGSFTSGFASTNMGFSSISNGGIGPSSLPVAYRFILTPGGTIANLSWFLSVTLNGNQELIGSGLGTGSISGVGMYNVGSTANSGSSYRVDLSFDFDSGTVGDSLNVNMAGLAGGVAINANTVPEPSTFAMLAGLGSMGLIWLRRLRRAVSL